MKCPNCKFENKSDAKLCSKCGHPIILEKRWSLTHKSLWFSLAIIFGFIVILHIAISFLYI